MQNTISASQNYWDALQADMQQYINFDNAIKNDAQFIKNMIFTRVFSGVLFFALSNIMFLLAIGMVFDIKSNTTIIFLSSIFFIFSFIFCFVKTKNEIKAINQSNSIPQTIELIQKFLKQDRFLSIVCAFNTFQKSIQSNSQYISFGKKLDRFVKNYKDNKLDIHDIVFFEDTHQSLIAIESYFDNERQNTAKQLEFIQ